MERDILEALDGEGGTGTLAERVRAVVAEVRRRRGNRVFPDAAITDALRQTGGNALRAARLLGCTDTCVGRRLKRNPTLMPEGLSPLGRGRPAQAANDDADKAVA